MFCFSFKKRILRTEWSECIDFQRRSKRSLQSDGKDEANSSDATVWTPACEWFVCFCLFLSQMFWSSGQKVSPGRRPRWAAFSALSGMRAFLVLSQAADSQRRLLGSNSADHRLLPLRNRKTPRTLSSGSACFFPPFF